MPCDCVTPVEMRCSCGQQFGSCSLKIHIPQCLGKWNKVNAMKPAGERRATPTTPPELQTALPMDTLSIDAFNNKMSALFTRASLATCSHCGRSFSDEAFIRHQKICRREHPAKPASQARISPLARDTGRQGDPASGLSPAAHACGGASATAVVPNSGAALDGQSSVDDGGACHLEDLCMCSTCGRTFTQKALQRHAAICLKATKQARNRVAITGQVQGGMRLKPWQDFAQGHRTMGMVLPIIILSFGLDIHVHPQAGADHTTVMDYACWS